MEDIKVLFKHSIIITIACVVLGLITRNLSLLFGFSGGCAISILGLYMLSEDAKAISYCRDVRTAKRIAYSGYAKRYFLYLGFLAVVLYFFDDFKVFLGGAIGLLNVKFNIYFMVFHEKVKKYLK